MIAALDLDLGAEHRPEDPQLSRAEALTAGRRAANRTVVLDQQIAAVGPVAHRRHIALVAALGSQGRETLGQALVRPDALAISFDLLPGTDLEQAVEPLRAEGLGDRADQIERELAVSVGEKAVGRLGQAPQLGRPADWPALGLEGHQALVAQAVEVLAHGHGRHAQAPAKFGRLLGAVLFQQVEHGTPAPGALGRPGLILGLIERHGSFLKIFLEKEKGLMLRSFLKHNLSKQEAEMPDAGAPTLVAAAKLDELKAAGRKVVKLGGKQIVLFHTETGVYACNNRCPHEGYPLKEGSLMGGCVLTCNWHNWKFDLESGETLVGGDRLRRYPVTLRDGEVWLDLSEPPAEQRAREILDSLHASFRRHEYDRMAREVSRLQQIGAEPLEAIRQAIWWTHDRFEFGTTHAHAAAADWLSLRDGLNDPAERLVPLIEILGHLAWDSLREPVYPYPAGTSPYDPEALVAAIEREDEPAAVALLRGALADGLGFAELEGPLARAALAHYADFGHAAIYVLKTGQLIEALGPEVAEPLLLLLVRSLIFTSREDLIPEFRAYAPALAAWDGAGGAPVKPEDLLGLSVRQVLARTLESSARIDELYDALLGAAAWQMLHFDLALQDRTDNPVSQNVGWLDFTHAITFANAARSLSVRYPELWPASLLQIACFLGRNSGYLDRSLATDRWQVTDPDAFLAERMAGLLDHGNPEYIVSCHLLKELSAVQAELAAQPGAPWAGTLLAAVNRFLSSPLKRKHSRRTANQALSFVALEG